MSPLSNSETPLLLVALEWGERKVRESTSKAAESALCRRIVVERTDDPSTNFEGTRGAMRQRSNGAHPINATANAGYKRDRVRDEPHGVRGSSFSNTLFGNRAIEAFATISSLTRQQTFWRIWARVFRPGPWRLS